MHNYVLKLEKPEVKIKSRPATHTVSTPWKLGASVQLCTIFACKIEINKDTELARYICNASTITGVLHTILSFFILAASCYPPELDLANCMLFSVREKAGLGSPPSPYYTNEVE